MGPNTKEPRQIGSVLDSVIVADKRTGFVICSEPRSGSTYLAQLLASTGVLGCPAEVFSTDEDVRRANGDPKGHIRRWLDLTVTPNGVYGIKVFSHQFDLVEESRWLEFLDSPVFIHFQREDLLGQAISSVRAQQTGQFESVQRMYGVPKFAPHLIRAALIRIAHNQARWCVFFARNGITPLRLTYEQLAQDPQSVAELVADRVGVSRVIAIDPSKVKLRVQRDDLTESWRTQFVGICSDVSYLDDDLGRIRPNIRRWRNNINLLPRIRVQRGSA